MTMPLSVWTEAVAALPQDAAWPVVETSAEPVDPAPDVPEAPDVLEAPDDPVPFDEPDEAPPCLEVPPGVLPLSAPVDVVVVTAVVLVVTGVVVVTATVAVEQAALVSEQYCAAAALAFTAKRASALADDNFTVDAPELTPRYASTPATSRIGRSAKAVTLRRLSLRFGLVPHTGSRVSLDFGA
jgi:hypothetical protein